MSTLLYRIGRVAYHRAWLVLVSWVLLLAAALEGFAPGALARV